MNEPIFDNFKVNEKVGTFTNNVVVERSTDLASEVNVLCVNTCAYITDSFVEDGKIKFNGKEIFYLLYKNENNEVNKKEYGVEFNGAIENNLITSACKYKITSCVEKEGFKNGKLQSIISVKADVYCENNFQYVSEGEGLILNKKEVEITKNYGVKAVTYPIEEEYELNYQIKEVLSQSACAYPISVQSGVGCIIVDGECIFNALLLQNIEKSDIIKESKVIPFRVEIEYEECMPNMLSTASVSVKEVKTDIAVDGDNGKSTVTVSVGLNLSGESFFEENVFVCLDAFSMTEEVTLESEECVYSKPCSVFYESKRVNGRANVNLTAGSRLMAIQSSKVEVSSVECTDNGLIASGIILTKCYYIDTDGVINVADAECMFSETLEYNCQFNPTVEACVKDISARIISLSEIELNAELAFTVQGFELHSVKCIKNVTACGEKAVSDCAISVYIPMENEELWSLSKRLNVSPEILTETNKELQFPLSGNERIVVYRQK